MLKNITGYWKVVNVIIRNNWGPKTESWGTPVVIGSFFEQTQKFSVYVLIVISTLIYLDTDLNQ